jgi:hypothetical protein
MKLIKQKTSGTLCLSALLVGKALGVAALGDKVEEGLNWHLVILEMKKGTNNLFRICRTRCKIFN